MHRKRFERTDSKTLPQKSPPERLLLCVEHTLRKNIYTSVLNTPLVSFRRTVRGPVTNVKKSTVLHVFSYSLTLHVLIPPAVSGSGEGGTFVVSNLEQEITSFRHTLRCTQRRSTISILAV